MLLKPLLILLNISLCLSAPIDGCNGAVECMYKKLQQRAMNQKPLPCKRMFTRPGKRSVDDADCIEEDDGDMETTPSQNERRIFIERLLEKLEERKELDDNLQLEIDDNPQVESNPRAAASSESDVSDEESNALKAQIKRLNSKIAQIQESGEVHETEGEDRISDIKISDDVRQKLQKVQEDINNILPLISDAKPQSNMRELELLSRRLSEEDKQAAMPSTAEPSTTLLPSTQKNTNNLESKMETLDNVINNLIEVDKLAYLNLKAEIDEMKNGQ